MKKLILILSIFLSFYTFSYSQSFKDWDDENVDEFYVKNKVKSGTLSEDGKSISFILIPASMKQGVYDVEISDYKNDLYEIKDTDYYIKFRGYYGYAGYGDEGVLVVGSNAWSSTFYKKP